MNWSRVQGLGFRVQGFRVLFGGSWVAISGAIRPLVWVISYNESNPAYNPNYNYP